MCKTHPGNRCPSDHKGHRKLRRNASKYCGSGKQAGQDELELLPQVFREGKRAGIVTEAGTNPHTLVHRAVLYGGDRNSVRALIENPAVNPEIASLAKARLEELEAQALASQAKRNATAAARRGVKDSVVVEPGAVVPVVEAPDLVVSPERLEFEAKAKAASEALSAAELRRDEFDDAREENPEDLDLAMAYREAEEEARYFERVYLAAEANLRKANTRPAPVTQAEAEAQYKAAEAAARAAGKDAEDAFYEEEKAKRFAKRKAERAVTIMAASREEQTRINAKAAAGMRKREDLAEAAAAQTAMGLLKPSASSVRRIGGGPVSDEKHAERLAALLKTNPDVFGGRTEVQISEALSAHHKADSTSKERYSASRAAAVAAKQNLADAPAGKAELEMLRAKNTAAELDLAAAAAERNAVIAKVNAEQERLHLAQGNFTPSSFGADVRRIDANEAKAGSFAAEAVKLRAEIAEAKAPVPKAEAPEEAEGLGAPKSASRKAAVAAHRAAAMAKGAASFAPLASAQEAHEAGVAKRASDRAAALAQNDELVRKNEARKAAADAKKPAKARKVKAPIADTKAPDAKAPAVKAPKASPAPVRTAPVSQAYPAAPAGILSAQFAEKIASANANSRASEVRRKKAQADAYDKSQAKA